MNALIKSSVEGELLSPSEMISVYGTVHPLNATAGSRIHCHIPAGYSILEILAEALQNKPGHVLRKDLVVKIGNNEIPESEWSRVRVKAGQVVTFIPRPQGGNVLRTVLGIALSVAAITIAGPAGGFIASTAIGAAIGISATVATALVAGGILLAGTFALNALFPIRPPTIPEVGAAASMNSIQGAKNQTNLYGPIPVILGKHRQSPYYAAKPYTEIVGEDQYLRLLFCLGYGPMDITELKIGETPLELFSDYEIEIRNGIDGDAPITLYPGSVDEVALQINLDNSVDAAGVAGNGGVWTTQTTAPDTDEISLDFTATQGVYKVDSKTGAIQQWGVDISIRYREVGDVAWIDLSDIVMTRSIKPFRVGVRWTVSRGQYEVQTRKHTGNGDVQTVKDTVVWSAIRSTRNMAAVSFPQPLALVALRIRATDQLSGIIDTFNCVCTSLVNAFSGSPSVWNLQTASQWPSDLFRLVLQGPANARPVPDSQIDIANLEEWWSYCVSKGFKFNQIRGTVTSISDALDDIASAGRAVKTYIDGKWGVIWDRPEDPIVQHFTPRNSWGFQGLRTYTQQPHGWRVTFINEDNGYTTDERIVYDDGYDSSNAELFEGIQFPGVTDPDSIWKHGRFHIAQNRLRPEKISLQVGWEHLVCNRGDRVRVTHDILLVGLASGRIKSINGQNIEFDELLTIEDGKTYGVQFRTVSGMVDRSVDVTPAGDYATLTLVGDLTGLTRGDLFAFGETDQESSDYRIHGISHQKDLIATLTLVDDAPEISEADSGEIPEYDPNITVPADPFSLPPRDFKYLEVIDGSGASVRALVRLFWQVPRFGRISSFHIQQKDDDSGGAWTDVDSVLPPRTTTDIPLISSGTWSFRIRCIFTDGTTSDWSTLAGLSLDGLTTAPGDITNLHQHTVDGQTVLDWIIVNDQRIVSYEIRKGTSWDTALLVGEAIAQPPWPTTGDGTYHVRAYILSPFGTRIYSDSIYSITIADSIVYRNIIISKDEQADGWTGSLDGGVISGSFIRTDAGLSITLPFAEEVIEDLDLEGLHIAVYISTITVNIGRPAECRFWTEYEASGILQGEDWLAQTDVLASEDTLGNAPTRFIRAFPIWRFSSAGDADIFSTPDVFDPPDVFTTGIEWGEWTAIASGTRVERYFQAGYVLITDSEPVDATGTKFSWFVDVPDRNDDYTQLTVLDTGLDITFYSGGYAENPPGGVDPIPFNGGPNGSLVPHVQRGQVDSTNGDEVKITNLTLSGCTVHVVNAGVNVTRSGVNLLVRGY